MKIVNDDVYLSKMNNTQLFALVEDLGPIQWNFYLHNYRNLVVINRILPIYLEIYGQNFAVIKNP